MQSFREGGEINHIDLWLWIRKCVTRQRGGRKMKQIVFIIITLCMSISYAAEIKKVTNEKFVNTEIKCDPKCFTPEGKSCDKNSECYKKCMGLENNGTDGLVYTVDCK